MTDMKIVLWTGGDAPNRQATLTVSSDSYRGPNHNYYAYWDPGYCGCPDCHPIVGYGSYPDAAIADYWEQWEDKYAALCEECGKDCHSHVCQQCDKITEQHCTCPRPGSMTWCSSNCRAAYDL